MSGISHISHIFFGKLSPITPRRVVVYNYHPLMGNVEGRVTVWVVGDITIHPRSLGGFYAAVRRGVATSDGIAALGAEVWAPRPTLLTGYYEVEGPDPTDPRGETWLLRLQTEEGWWVEATYLADHTQPLKISGEWSVENWRGKGLCIGFPCEAKSFATIRESDLKEGLLCRVLTRRGRHGDVVAFASRIKGVVFVPNRVQQWKENEFYTVTLQPTRNPRVWRMTQVEGDTGILPVSPGARLVEGVPLEGGKTPSRPVFYRECGNGRGVFVEWVDGAVLSQNEPAAEKALRAVFRVEAERRGVRNPEGVTQLAHAYTVVGDLPTSKERG